MKRIFYMAIFLYFFCLVPFAEARTRVVVPITRSLTLDCVVDAAKAHQVPLAALLGILSVEGGHVGEALSNTNGTWDLGAFQINTCHTNVLIKKGVNPMAVLSDGSINAHIAAWLLREELNRTDSIWQAIGTYHSRTPNKRDNYIAKVHAHILRLQEQGFSSLPFLGKENTQ